MHPNTDNENIIDINETNAQQVLIEQSQHKLVVSLFWSPQEPASTQLIPLLEQLLNEYQQQFIFAKINVDTMMAIAQQLGVQGLPTVMVFQAGQAVDAIAGPQDDAALRSLLEKFLPKPWDLQLQQAQQLMTDENFGAALELLTIAYDSSSQRSDIAKSLAHCLIERGRLDEASALLDAILMAEQDTYFQQLQSQLELKRNAADSPEIKALEKKLHDQPEDLAIKMQLALQYYEVQQHRQACEYLIAILHVDKNYDNCRKTLLDIFKSLGNNDPLVIEFQRQLFSLLY